MNSETISSERLVAQMQSSSSQSVNENKYLDLPLSEMFLRLNLVLGILKVKMDPTTEPQAVKVSPQDVSIRSCIKEIGMNRQIKL
jgi:hypothetical protein